MWCSQFANPQDIFWCVKCFNVAEIQICDRNWLTLASSIVNYTRPRKFPYIVIALDSPFNLNMWSSWKGRMKGRMMHRTVNSSEGTTANMNASSFFSWKENNYNCFQHKQVLVGPHYLMYSKFPINNLKDWCFVSLVKKISPADSPEK